MGTAKPDPSGSGSSDSKVSLHGLWHRRQSTKFNSVSYIVQRGAEATYTDAGKQQVRALINFYMTNAKLIRESLSKAGMKCFGGENAPYVWIQTPKGVTSWQFFDKLLNEAHVVCTPGSGFGAAGEGYVRLSAFNSRENVQEALKRIAQKLH